jgi:hypothetical protein
MRRAEGVVSQHFADVLNALKAALAVIAVGCLADNRQPTTLILVGRSGAGKSMALNFLMPRDEQDKLAKFLYRSDKLTAASFVSHKADLTPEELDEVDLLPRIDGKTMLSKELAPFFSGKREELLDRFAHTASVLDGAGFISDSGSHGRRGYAEPINFQWLGATTPLSSELLDIMASVGPRILFYDADRPRKDLDALVEYAEHYANTQAMEDCRVAVHELLLRFHRSYPPGTVQSDEVVFGRSHLRHLALWADVLTRLRARNSPIDEGELEPEHPERVLGMLRNFDIGSALIHGRVEVNDYDLAQVAHIGLSSGNAGQGRVLRAMLQNGGKATTPKVAKLAAMSTPTALKHMAGLAMAGVARFIEGEGTRAAKVELDQSFTELRTAPLLKAKRGKGEHEPPEDDADHSG